MEIIGGKKMTKKDFIRLADHLRGIQLSPDALSAICAFCRESNPRFNETIFRGYLAGTCGPAGGKKKA